MKKSNLIIILSTFSKDEMKRFGQFVDSPYFQTGRKLKPLYLLLKKNHSEFKPEKLSDEKIFQSLYPDKKFDKKKSSQLIRVLFTEITRLAKKFLAYDMIENGNADYTFVNLQTTAFREKKLLKHAFQVMNEASEQLDKNEKGLQYYLRRLETYNTLSYDILMNMGKQKEIARYVQPSLLYIYAFIFQNLTRFLNSSFINKYSYNISFRGINLVKKFIESFDTELFEMECHDDGYGTKNIILYDYYIIRSRLDESDKESLMNALETYYKLFDKASSEIKWFCFQMLFNRFIDRLRLNKVYSEKACELYDFIFEKEYNIFDIYHVKALYSYFNIVKIKAYLLKTEELLEFINRFSEKIPRAIADEVKNYSMSFYYFKKKQFGKCLECISKNDNLGERVMVNKYRLKICSLYELGQFEESIYALDSFEHFMRRNTSIGNIIAEGMDFIEAAKNLFKLENKENHSHIKIKVANKYSLYDDWFNEKIQDLKKGIQPVPIAWE